MKYSIFKRFLDLLLAVGLLIILGPFIFLMMGIVFLEDFGNPIYTSSRVGLNGKIFDMYKIRSMYRNSPDLRLLDNSTYNGKDDVRVTKTGKFLRRTSLDELPQILNVLTGDMSIIGPRPDPKDFAEYHIEKRHSLLSVRPGITGLNQVLYRNESNTMQKIKLDNFYADKYNFTFDLLILVKTFRVVLKSSKIHISKTRV
jgi:undecaprenyl phosphate N,N'-diacetylbacillosamine 1-phosphate transferase